MNKHAIFWKIIRLSLLLGLQSGAILGLATGLFYALIDNFLAAYFWFVFYGLGYGCVLGLVLGLVNGLLIACLICFFFYPSTRGTGLRWITQAASVAISVLISLALTRMDFDWNPFPLLSFLPVITGLAAWCASCRVDNWYEKMLQIRLSVV